MTTTLGVGSNAGYDVPSWSTQLSFNPSTNTYSGNPEMLHTGSWGTPDFNLTELVGKVLGAEPNAQGGSNLTTSSVEQQRQQAVDKMVQQGWDRTAAEQDILANPSKITSLLGVTGGGGSAPAPTPTTYNVRGTTVQAPNPTEAVKSVFPTTDYGNYANQFNPDEFFRIIDENYNATNALNDSNQSALEQASNQFGTQINADYAANQSKAEATRTSTSQNLDQNEIKAEQNKQDALNAARQLYNELQMGYRQRFGGSTSAGEAAQTLLANEQQRQSGQIGRQYQGTVADIEGQRTDLINNYNTAIRELDSQKQAALSQVQQTFLTNLTNINNNRAASLQAKNDAKLQVLQNARNQTLQIAQQREAFAQQLQANIQQQQLALDTAYKQMQMNAGTYTQNAAAAVNKIPTTITTNMTPSNVTATRTATTTPQSINTSTGYYAGWDKNSAYEDWLAKNSA